MRSLVGHAVEVVDAHLSDGDLGAALAVLRLVRDQLNLPENDEHADAEDVYNALFDAETKARYRDPLDCLLADLQGNEDALAKARAEAEVALLDTAT